MVAEEIIDKTSNWTYFDGASSQGNPAMGGERGILYIFEANRITFTTGIGLITNNKVETLVLELI